MRKYMSMLSFMCPSGINDFPMTNSTHIKEGLSVLAKFKRPLLVHAEVVLDSESNLNHDGKCSDVRSYETYVRTRPPSWLAFGLMMLQQLGGVNAIGFYKLCKVHQVM
ncbi:allantoinase-like isoform X2 [Asparagus officinalis]|nr:allantoinase-like isoform X2 [Asparagus officinalis]XP_020262137.1 allantoinase-like isoform X2 [Asparagus officinalis]